MKMKKTILKPASVARS